MSEYIDKFDALTADFRISVSLFESRRKTAEKAVQEYANYIRELPAADVRPVARGKWIYNDSEQLEDVFVDTMRCSCCGECADKEIHIFQYCIELEYRYCPNCGADMREES